MTRRHRADAQRAFSISSEPEGGAQGELTVGVDEAGRGAVLGPLVLAACALTPAAERRLIRLGVADSKVFGSSEAARARRAELAAAIRREAAWVAVCSVPAEQVDQAVRHGGLNRLEQRVAAELLSDAPPYARLVFDGARLFSPLARRMARAEARNRADQTVLAVAAASILAKVTRDEAFVEIATRYASLGPVTGGGYPNAATAAFLDRFWAAHRRLPPETRCAWQWAPVARRVQQPGAGRALSLPFDT